MKTLIIGLDGATFDLIEPWLKNGHMPVLKRLQETGVAGELTTTLPPITPSAWPSFYTGKNPGQHGIFDFMQRRPGSYQTEAVNATHCRSAALWDILGAHEKQSLVVNVPMTYPARPLNGVMVTGLMTPRSSRLQEIEFTYPPDLADELLSLPRTYHIVGHKNLKIHGLQAFVEDLQEVLLSQFEATRYLLTTRPWDMATFVIGGTDTIQHPLWHCVDSQHPMYEPTKARAGYKAMRSFYSQVDTKVGELIELAQPDYVIILSDHGMGPVYKWIYLNIWLEQQGYMRLKSNLKKVAFRAGLTPRNGYLIAERLGISKSRVGHSSREKLLQRLFLSFADIDWSRTSAYAVGHIGKIYLNVRGREPEGIVEPGVEYEALRQHLRQDLLSLVDPETGVQPFKEVLFREEVYNGNYLEMAPDLLIVPADWTYQVLGATAFDHNKTFSPTFGNTGDHRMNGIFLMAGDGVKTGVPVTEARLIDIAPTVLYLMGIPIPNDMDGRVLTETIEPRMIEKTPPRFGPPLPFNQGAGYDYSEKEAKEIEDRLRALGYLS